MSRVSQIQYNPALSVKENAKKNGVSEAAIRYYIKVNAIDRRFDRKQNVIDDCRNYLKKHPNATWEELQHKTGHSLSTMRKYRQYIITEEELTDFDNRKAKRRNIVEERKKQEWAEILETIPREEIYKYLDTIAKKRGGFYTPREMVDFLLDWALDDKDDATILEPSCGEGVFLKALKERPEGKYRFVTAVELDDVDAGKASAIKLPNSEVLNTDFYQFCLSESRRFDIVVGNPPYIRIQRQTKEERALAEQIFTRSGIEVSKMASSWASFIVGSTQLLSEFGRLAMVVPAEIMKVNYAVPIRQFLKEQFNNILIVSFKYLPIKGIQQDVVLLLCERDGTSNLKIEQIEVDDAVALSRLGSRETPHYYPREEEFINTLSEQKNVLRLSNFAKVEVGITTGADKFFLVGKGTVNEYHLQDYSRPAIGRSASVKGALVSLFDCQENETKGVRCNLLVFPKNLNDTALEETIRYIKQGEADGVNTGYKTQNRSPWFVVPSVHGSDALFTRQFGDYSRLILNEANVLTTGSLHRVSIKDGISKEALVASYYNSLTYASVELAGRSMGGGAMTLLPREVESVFIPYSPDYAELLPTIDKMLRDGEKIETILNLTDSVILEQGMGLSQEEIEHIRGIWISLREHRLQKNQRTMLSKN